MSEETTQSSSGLKVPFHIFVNDFQHKNNYIVFQIKKKRDLLMKFGKKHLCCSLVGQEVLSYNQA